LLGDWNNGASLGSFVVFVASRACCRASSIDEDRRIFWASLATASSSSGLVGVGGAAAAAAASSLSFSSLALASAGLAAPKPIAARIL
jgi:hypothetical protein